MRSTSATSCSELAEHLKSRRCDPNFYNVVLDEGNCVATFMIFNQSGKIVGYQTYRPDRSAKSQSKGTNPKELRYFTYVTGEGNSKALALWGFESFHRYPSRDLYLCEGIFDACALHDIGLRALAVLCNNPKPLRPWLSTFPGRVVGVLDGDAAGSALAKVCDRVIVCPAGKDPADMTREELLEMTKNE